MEKGSKEKGILSITHVNVKAKGPEKKSRGPMFLSTAYGKVRSRYMNATMGSCHDLCKYGHKHEFEDEEKHTAFKRFMTNSIASDAVQNHVRGLNIGDRRKSSGLIKLKASDKAKVLQQNMQPEEKEVGMSEIPIEINIKIPSEDHAMSRSLLLEKKSIKFPRQTILQDSSVEENHMKGLNSNKKKKKKQAVKPKASLVPESSPVKQNKLNQRSSLASTEITLGSDPNIFKEKVASYMKETVTFSALKMNNQKKTTVRKRSGSSKLQNEKNKVSLPKQIDGSAKPAFSLKVRVPLVRSIAQLNATRNLEGSRNLDRKVSKSFKMLNVGDRNFPKLQKASIYSTTPVHDVVSLKVREFKNLEHATRARDEKADDGVDFHEDIQEIIEAKSENEDMVVNDENFSKESDGYTSESCVSELSDEIEDGKRKQSCELSEEEEKRRVRTTPAVQLDDSSSLPYKMKFKRGRVIDLRPTENVGPRRLRFRRGRVLDENSNGEGMKRILRRGDMDAMKAPGAVSHANSLEASAVMLKHQDAQEKKDMQALFNHVIEETASKLVETRKSKVKALVGAFETVISLQETKAAQLV